MRKLMAGTGWKMNHKAAAARDYCEKLLPELQDIDFSKIDVFLLPPFTSLHAVHPVLKDSPVKFGAQNMHWVDSGAWTGEIAAPMLVEAGCAYIELGHSERRYFFNETDEFVNKKVLSALAHDLQTIICLGETAEEKRSGNGQEVLRNQVTISLKGVPVERIPENVLAYEPRWAIGQNEAASPDYIQQIHEHLRQILVDLYGTEIASQTRIIYGGSVNMENAHAIIQQPEVDGLFIGRAALDPINFARLIRIVTQVATS